MFSHASLFPAASAVEGLFCCYFLPFPILHDTAGAVSSQVPVPVKPPACVKSGAVISGCVLPWTSVAEGYPLKMESDSTQGSLGPGWSGRMLRSSLGRRMPLMWEKGLFHTVSLFVLWGYGGLGKRLHAQCFVIVVVWLGLWLVGQLCGRIITWIPQYILGIQFELLL